MLAKRAPAGDVEAVGEDGHAENLAFGSGGKYVYVSGFDGLAQLFGEGFGDGFAVSEGRFEERQGFGEVGGGGDLDRAQRPEVVAKILVAASTAVSMSLSSASRWVHRRTKPGLPGVASTPSRARARRNSGGSSTATRTRLVSGSLAS